MNKDKVEQVEAATAQDDEDLLDDVFITVDTVDECMVTFFMEVSEIRIIIDRIKCSLQLVKGVVDEIVSTHDQTTNQTTRAKLDELVTDIQKSSTLVRSKLKKIENHFDRDSRLSLSWRIQRLHHYTLTLTLVQLMREFTGVLTNYKEHCKGRLRRQLEMNGISLGPKDLQERIEETINFVLLTRSTESQMLIHIQARQEDIDDIVKLQESITQLHRLCTDMTLYVQQQGVTIDRRHMDTKEANIQVVTQKVRTVKRRRILSVICVILAILVVMSAIVYFVL